MPTLTATPSAGTIICNHGWTQEMNVDTPNDGDNGDYETIPKLREKYAFCDDGNIIAARCYKAGTNITSDRTGETVTCDHTKGLTCNNWEQLNQSAGKCSDYSIRFYCNCRYSKSQIYALFWFIHVIQPWIHLNSWIAISWVWQNIVISWIRVSCQFIYSDKYPLIF